MLLFGLRDGIVTRYSNCDFDEIKTFMTAGSETTSNFLTAMHLLIFEKPAVAARLKSEIDSKITDDRDITPENLKEVAFP